MNSFRYFVLFFVFVFTIGSASPAYGAEGVELSKGYYSIVNEAGEMIFQTSFPISVGDMFIDENNIKWVVIEIKGTKAVAKRKEKIDISQYTLPKAYEEKVIPAAVSVNNKLIGIYHTHDDESYQPSDGYSNAPQGKGTILKVGTALASKLRNEGFKVIHSTASHYPHDAGAYDRSRRTAIKILRENPMALFDVHRDATPASAYQRDVDNTRVAAVTLVVGRQNPNMRANEQFAMRLKAQLDKNYPHYVKGIFFAHGNYNQDLFPRALLLEFGTNTLPRQEAMRSARIFATAVPKVLYGAGNVNNPYADENNAQDAGGAWKALGWIIGLVVIGGGIFLVISSGSFELAGKRLNEYIGREFANYLGFLTKNRKK